MHIVHCAACHLQQSWATAQPVHPLRSAVAIAAGAGWSSVTHWDCDFPVRINSIPISQTYGISSYYKWAHALYNKYTYLLKWSKLFYVNSLIRSIRIWLKSKLSNSSGNSRGQTLLVIFCYLIVLICLSVSWCTRFCEIFMVNCGYFVDRTRICKKCNEDSRRGKGQCGAAGIDVIVTKSYTSACNISFYFVYM